jgi:hypothetical protein
MSFRIPLFGTYDSQTGIFLKDLNPGVGVARVSLSHEDQTAITDVIRHSQFHNLPDTLSRGPETPYFIFVDDGSKRKMVVWRTANDEHYQDLRTVMKAIMDVIKNKPEVKKLPPTRVNIEL